MGTHLYISIILWGLVVSVSPCTDGERKAFNVGNSHYMKCFHGKWYLMTCPNGYIFDTLSSGCIQGTFTKWTDVGKCDQEFYHHPKSCSVFYRCKDGRLKTKFCPIGEVFDSEFGACRVGKSCERPTIPTSAVDRCEDGVRRVSCREYTVCTGGKLSVMRCPLGEVFDDINKTCTTGSCTHRPKRAASDCEEGTKKRVSGECKKYLHCVNGIEQSETCSPCTNFDDEKQSCTFVFENPCSVTPTPEPTPEPTTQPSTEPTPEPTTQPSTEPTPEPTTQPSTEPTPEPTTEPVTETPTPTAVCVEGEKRPYSGDCKKYLECKKGILVVQECGYWRHFDSKDLSCAWFFYTCA